MPGEGGEKWLDFEYILEIESTEYRTREQRKKSRMTARDWPEQSDKLDGSAIFSDGEH